MRLVTIQDKAAYDDLCASGVLRCKPELAKWLHEDAFCVAYDWLAEQMKKRISDPPQGVDYPIWAWYMLDGKPARVDLRKGVFSNYRGEQYALTIEVPEGQVLLSDEESWYSVLNDSLLSGADSEEAYEEDEAWFGALPPGEKQDFKHVSWEGIFDIDPFENDWHRRGFDVQATFWELQKEQVVAVRRFIGRQQ